MTATATPSSLIAAASTAPTTAKNEFTTSVTKTTNKGKTTAPTIYYYWVEGLNVPRHFELLLGSSIHQKHETKLN